MRNIDIATEVFVFQWGCFGASLEDIRNKIIDLGIAEKQVVLKKNQEDMEDLFYQLAKFYDLHRLRVRGGTSEGQVGSTEVSKCLNKTKEDHIGMSIGTKAMIFMQHNDQRSLEELRDTIVSLDIAREHVVVKKNREDMVNLLYRLSTFGDYTKIRKRNISAKEKKRVKKLMERVKKEGPIKLKGVTHINKNISN